MAKGKLVPDDEKKKPATMTGLQKAQAGLQLAKAAGVGSRSSSEGGQSTAGAALGGAASGAATGAAFGAKGAVAGAVIGGVVGGLKAKSARKAAQRKAQAEAEATKQEALSEIEGQKASRINQALGNLQQVFSQTLTQRKKVRL